jgi:hypothetical protein
MAKSKPSTDPIPSGSVSEGSTVIVETIDDTNKAVIDSTPPTQPAPMPLDMRIAAMLGMGLDTVRERMVGKKETVLLQLVEDRNHPDLAAMLAVNRSV